MKENDSYQYAMDRLAAGADPERVIQELKDANIPISRIRDIVGDASGNLIRRDYYEVLSISRTATSEEIKRAFRRTALQVHPDRNINPGAAERFKQINAIYQTLSDPQKRAEYDRSLRNTSGSHEQSRQAGGASNTQRSRAGTAKRDEHRPRGSTPVTYGMRRMAATLLRVGHDPNEIVAKLVALGVSESTAQILVEDVSLQVRRENSRAREHAPAVDIPTSNTSMDWKPYGTIFIYLLGSIALLAFIAGIGYAGYLLVKWFSNWFFGFFGQVFGGVIVVGSTAAIAYGAYSIEKKRENCLPVLFGYIISVAITLSLIRVIGYGVYLFLQWLWEWFLAFFGIDYL